MQLVLPVTIPKTAVEQLVVGSRAAGVAAENKATGVAGWVMAAVAAVQL